MSDVTSYMGHLENKNSLSYAEFPNVDTHHDTLFKKPHLFKITTNLIRKACSCWEALEFIMIQVSKFLIFI